jgi:hypothetical protein
LEYEVFPILSYGCWTLSWFKSLLDQFSKNVWLLYSFSFVSYSDMDIFVNILMFKYFR